MLVSVLRAVHAYRACGHVQYLYCTCTCLQHGIPKQSPAREKCLAAHAVHAYGNQYKYFRPAINTPGHTHVIYPAIHSSNPYITYSKTLNVRRDKSLAVQPPSGRGLRYICYTKISSVVCVSGQKDGCEKILYNTRLGGCGPRGRTDCVGICFASVGSAAWC
jgi:hypothetical protein